MFANLRTRYHQRSNASEPTPLLQGTEDLAILRLLILVDAIADLQAIITTLQSASMRFPYDAATTAENYRQLANTTRLYNSQNNWRMLSS
jgi:hypothetical protein